MRDIIKHNIEMRNKYNREFAAIFGVALSNYWSNLTGFDVVRFDEKVIHSGDRSMSEVIEEKYGKAAADMIEALL